MFEHVLAADPAQPGPAAGVHLPAPLVRQEDRAITARELRPERRRRPDHERAVQRRGRAPGQDLRRPAGASRRTTPTRSAASATSASPRALYATWFRVGLTTLVAASPSPSSTASAASWRSAGSSRSASVVALTAYLGRLYGPLTAMSNVQVDVMTRWSASSACSRCSTWSRRSRRSRTRPTCARRRSSTARSSSSTHVAFRYPAADEVSLASLESVATLPAEINEDTLDDVSFTVPAGHMVALVGHSGAGKTTISQLVTRMYDPTGGRGADRRHRPAGRHPGLAARDGRRGQPGGPPLPRHDRGEPALRPPGGHGRRHRARAGAGAHRDLVDEPARRHPHRRRRPRLPAVRRRAAARSRSPACCSRRPTS